MQPFKPFPLLANPHLQTILSVQLHWVSEPPSETQHVSLPDGDQLALDISTPANWRSSDLTVVLLHGLCGCHLSPYMVRMASKLWRLGIRAVRMNLRGCGSGYGLARHPYHSGRSEDLLAVLQTLKTTWPQSPIIAVGFSLSGNILIKLIGELRSSASDYLLHAIAVCPPLDLTACVQKFSAPSNWLYARRFSSLLRAAVAAREAAFPDMPPVTLPKHFTLYEFDTLFTAPQCGFQSAEDYYTQCSAAPLLPQVTLPCHILFAKDDPLIDATTLQRANLPTHINMIDTQHGGHLGFLGRLGRSGGFRWLDEQLLKWIQIASSHEPRHA